LLRLNERDVLNTLLTPPRLDLFTGRRLKPKCLIRDRLVERGRELAVPPKPVDHLDRAYRCVGTVKEHEQSLKVDRISARIRRPCGHLPQGNRIPERLTGACAGFRA